MIPSLYLPLALASLAAAHDHSNGMDMSMDGSMSLDMGNMLMYLHFTPGDMVLFLGWVPRSAGAMIGTCISLFLLAIVERWISACHAVMSAHWSRRAAILHADRMNAKGLPSSQSVMKKSASTTAVFRDAATLRSAPPFIPSHDLLRGLIYAIHMTLQFAFMLIVMTFQVGFILSIVIGLGVGETLFGRYGTSSAHL